MANKTITRSPYGQHDEARASTTIKCGYICERHTDTAGDDLVRPHSNDGGQGQILVAHEDALQGRSRETDYTADELVMLWHCNRGDRFIAKLKANENVSLNDKLVSAGDGTLQKASSTDTVTSHQVVLAIAREASNVASVADIEVEVAC